MHSYNNPDVPPEEQTIPDPEVDAALEGAMPPPGAEGGDVNLVPSLPAWYRKALAARVIEDAHTDRDSMNEWRELTAKHTKLYKGRVPDNIPGQENIQPVHVPYVRKAVKLFKAKAFPALYPTSGDIVAFKVSRPDPDLDSAALRVARDMNDLLRKGMPEWYPSHDRGMTQNLLEGIIFEICYWNPIEQRPATEIALADDVWVPYRHKSDREDLADVPRITWRKRYHRHELKALERSGWVVGVTKPISADEPALYPKAEVKEGDQLPSSKEPTPSVGLVKEESDAAMGHHPAVTDSDGPREVYEQDRWVELPDGDGIDRHATAVVDLQTGTLIRLVMVEKEDAKDRERWRREDEARAAQERSAQLIYQQQMDGYAAMLVEQQQQPMMEAPPVDPMTGAPMEGAAPMAPPAPPPPPPEPPPPLPEVAPVHKVPCHRWTIYRCEVDPEGMLGDGTPHDTAGHNTVANKLLTRYVTAQTLQLHPTIIASRQSRFQRGAEAVELKVGKINESPLAPAIVQAGAGMFILQHPTPDPNTFRVIEQQSYESQALTAFDIATGAPGKSGQTATETEAQNSNALGNIEMFVQRWNRARSNSLKNLLYLRSITLPDEGAPVDVETDDGEMVSDRVTRLDYELVLESADITFDMDLSMASKPVKVREAMKAFQTIQQLVQTPIMGDIPPVDPTTAVMLYRAAAGRVLKAMGLTEDAKLLERSPMPQMPGAAPPPGPQGEMPDEGAGGDATAAGPGGFEPMDGGPGDGMVPGGEVA